MADPDTALGQTPGGEVESHDSHASHGRESNADTTRRRTGLHAQEWIEQEAAA